MVDAGSIPVLPCILLNAVGKGKKKPVVNRLEIKSDSPDRRTVLQSRIYSSVKGDDVRAYAVGEEWGSIPHAPFMPYGRIILRAGSHNQTGRINVISDYVCNFNSSESITFISSSRPSRG